MKSLEIHFHKLVSNRVFITDFSCFLLLHYMLLNRVEQTHMPLFFNAIPSYINCHETKMMLKSNSDMVVLNELC